MTFGVSGMLWNRSLVMYDRETKSLWSHMLGEAMQGRLKGTKLKQIPSVMTDWKTWRAQHPASSVLWIRRTSKNYRREFYRRPEQFVLAIAAGARAKAWSLDKLTHSPVINDRWLDQPVVAVFERVSVTARLYDRTVGDRVLTFQFAGGKLTDRETGTIWEPTTGRALSGKLSGQYLKSLPAILSYKRSWLVFHPKSEFGRQ